MANKDALKLQTRCSAYYFCLEAKYSFENNSDKLKVASLSQLDELTKILFKYDAASLSH
jgi:hypothetical protein